MLASLFLIFERRKLLINTIFSSSQLGLFVLFLLCSGYIFGIISGQRMIELTSVTCMFPTIIWISFGFGLIRVLFFPLLFLMFIIPIQNVYLENRILYAWAALPCYAAYYFYLKVYNPEPDSILDKPAWAYQNARWLMPTLVAFIILMLSPWLSDNIRSFYPEKSRNFALRAPLGAEGWEGPFPLQTLAWAPLFLNASAFIQVEYFPKSSSAHDSVYVYSAYYHSDRSFKDILDPKNKLYDPNVWKISDLRTALVDIGNDETLMVYEAVLRAGAVSRLVWYWYYISGVSTIDTSLASILDKVRTISKYSQGSGLVMISASFNKEPEEARTRMREFANVMYGALDALKRPEITYTVIQPGK